jgi:predicted RNA-binding Zn-ribbon protein involved in translation (DUF1610 family)
MPAPSSSDPFCSACGYSLKGCTESSKCPECGRPIVEVLMRPSFQRRKGYRYQSSARIGNLPWISIALGPHDQEKVGKPVGVIAIGDLPLGIIAMGGLARGILAIGGMSLGVISFGGWSVGILAIGGFSMGVIAIGGVAIGAWAFGGSCFYLVRGFGGFARRLTGIW